SWSQSDVGQRGAIRGRRGSSRRKPVSGLLYRVLVEQFSSFLQGEIVILPEADARDGLRAGSIELVDPASVPTDPNIPPRAEVFSRRSWTNRQPRQWRRSR